MGLARNGAWSVDFIANGPRITIRISYPPSPFVSSVDEITRMKLPPTYQRADPSAHPHLFLKRLITGRGHKESHPLHRGALLQLLPKLKVLRRLLGHSGAALVVAGLRDPDGL